MFNTKLVTLPTSLTTTVTELSVSQCLWTCQVMVDCLAVSYQYSGQQCSLHSVNQYSPGVTVTPFGDWDYYEWHCGKLLVLYWKSTSH